MRPFYFRERQLEHTLKGFQLMSQKSPGVAGADVGILFVLKPKNSTEIIYTDTGPNGSIFFFKCHDSITFHCL